MEKFEALLEEISRYESLSYERQCELFRNS